ncbi:hypothetical protein MNBD_PLANCTO02-3000 [hydrothermal vent metagenome]|uniref:Uncharacterized protein n=1 Tax=hydrothermal vent metagenome TaxID=652676 RepID=A0A3B1DZ10_9ZZZZ
MDAVVDLVVIEVFVVDRVDADFSVLVNSSESFG